MKKVLLVIVDALATHVVQPAMEAGDLPNFRRLAEAGAFVPECLSIFPSITPAATCSLVTGGYPFEHGISGAYWYETEQDEVAYFGDDLWAIFKEGVGQYINDFQVKLNRERLQAPTIFERIENEGTLSDAVVNYLWYRGRFDQHVSTPLLMKLLPGVSLQETLSGPRIMFLGDFVATEINGEKLSARGGLTRRYGFHDDTTADYLLQLAEKNALADFTLAYFPNNDFDSHDEGPQNALDTLKNVDEHFGNLFELRGGLENFLSEFAILITGDHSQSDLDDDPAVDMNELLQEFEIVEAGTPWRNGEELMVCPNMRAAQIYLRPDLWKRRQDVIDALLRSDAIDQVIVCDNDGCLKQAQNASFQVFTRDRGQLEFAVGGGQQDHAEDEFGNAWSWEGDLSTVDGRVVDGKLTFGDYPNAFERIATGFFEATGHVWVTARLGKEFCLPDTHANSKGSHGSLHRLDSTPPLIAAGLPADQNLPPRMRSVDVAPLCLEILGLQPPRPVGASPIKDRLETNT